MEQLTDVEGVKAKRCYHFFQLITKPILECIVLNVAQNVKSSIVYFADNVNEIYYTSGEWNYLTHTLET